MYAFITVIVMINMAIRLITTVLMITMMILITTGVIMIMILSTIINVSKMPSFQFLPVCSNGVSEPSTGDDQQEKRRKGAKSAIGFQICQYQSICLRSLLYQFCTTLHIPLLTPQVQTLNFGDVLFGSSR